MSIQVQENGSYKSEDVVAALDWMLPLATCPEESIVVLLDWYAGHRTDEVQEVLRRKGYVLLFHGSGTTPFTQVHDTHLHASVQRLLVEIENGIALARGRADVGQAKALSQEKLGSASVEDQSQGFHQGVSKTQNIRVNVTWNPTAAVFCSSHFSLKSGRVVP